MVGICVQKAVSGKTSSNLSNGAFQEDLNRRVLELDSIQRATSRPDNRRPPDVMELASWRPANANS
jgi:hypothetical protein